MDRIRLLAIFKAIKQLCQLGEIKAIEKIADNVLREAQTKPQTNEKKEK
jgi:hypothetical protein